MRITAIVISILFCIACDTRIKSDDQKIEDLIVKLKDNTFNSKRNVSIADTIVAIIDRSAADVTPELLITLHKIYYKAGRYREAHQVVNKFEQITSQDRDTAKLAMANHLKGRIYFKEAKYDSAYQYYIKANHLYIKSQSELNLATNYLDIASVLYAIEDHANCEDALRKAMKLFGSDTNGELGRYLCYDMFSRIYMELEYFRQAADFAQKANIVLERNPTFDIYKPSQFLLLGEINLKESDFKGAISNFSQVLFHAPQFDLRRARAHAGIASAYLFLQKPTIADNHIDAGLAIKTARRKDYINLNLLKASSLLNKNKISDFKSQENLMDSLLKTESFQKDQLKWIDLKMKVYPENSQALAQEYIAVNDSIKDSERIIRNKFAAISYRSDELLAEHQDANQNMLLLGIASITIILSGILLYKTRVQNVKRRELQLLNHRQQSNNSVYAMMSRKNHKIKVARKIEKQRIATEIKEKAIARLAIIRNQLLKVEHATDDEIDQLLEYIDEIQEVERDIREVAHGLNGSIFSENMEFNSVLQALLDKYGELHKADYFLEVQDEINWEITPAAIKMNLHQIIDDILKFVIKGKPKNIFVTVVTEIEHLKLIVLDDGDGIDRISGNNGSTAKFLMQRVQSHSGKLDIRPRQGKGTTIIVNLPHHKHLQHANKD